MRLFFCVMSTMFLLLTGMTGTSLAGGRGRQASSATTAHYKLEPKQSTFTLKVLTKGILSPFAHDRTIGITDFVGEASIVPTATVGSSARMEIQAGSLQVLNKVSADQKREIERRMRDEVLESAKYPKITFQTQEIRIAKIVNGVRYAQIVGNLTLHGVTKPLVFNAQVIRDEGKLRATGQFQINQTDFQIKLISAAGGAIKVKDTLTFSFDIVAYKEQ
ncbi:MAG: YceI family protein [Blastocatellia bacterium]|nr:YceI family protein [Blastocatellia bacterium]